MISVAGMFGAGDTISGSAHKFSSGSYTEGRIAGKSAVKYVNELTCPADRRIANQRVQGYRIQSVGYLLSRQERNCCQHGIASYISPLQGLQRLEKIMDENVGGHQH